MRILHTERLFLLAFALVLLFNFGVSNVFAIDGDPQTPPEEQPQQITICHYDSEEDMWSVLNINENAFGGHSGHGEGEVSDFIIEDGYDESFCDELINGPVEEVDETAPDMPVHVSPADGVTLTSAELTEIQWTDVTDPSTPVSYFYESANNSDTNPDGSFTSPAYQSGALSNSEIAAAGTPEGIWYWHVRARDFIGNFSAWTNAWQIIVDNTPSEEDPEYPYGVITNPSANENVFGLINLTAEYFDGDDENDDAVQWAVRAGTCEANTGTVAGNVDGFNDSFTWDGNMFSAPFDADLFELGEYCFIFNPADDGEVNVRETQLFNIVEEEEENETVYGCMDEVAINFNPLATEQGEVICEYDQNEEENENNEEVSETEDQTPEEEGRRSGRRRGGSVLGATTDGEVLGASTDSCSMYISDYMQKGHSNSSEVEKLQNFLNQQGFVVATTGVFGDATEEAVKQFQLKYKEEILMPWVNLGLSDGSPTGVVYKTTRWKINNMMCEGSEVFPILP